MRSLQKSKGPFWDDAIFCHSCLSAGNFTRYGYDKETETCEEFNYGGCKGDASNIQVTIYIYILLSFSLNYPGNFNSFMSMSECENSCKDGGSSRAMCLLPRWERNNLPRTSEVLNGWKNQDLQFSPGPRDPARIGFQSGTLTTLRNAACHSTTAGVTVEKISCRGS